MLALRIGTPGAPRAATALVAAVLLGLPACAGRPVALSAPSFRVEEAVDVEAVAPAPVSVPVTAARPPARGGSGPLAVSAPAPRRPRPYVRRQDGEAGGRDQDGDGVPDNVETTELAKKTQNPVADLISVPFQLNSGIDTGVRNNTKHTLNLQPVMPQKLNEDWNLIHRPVLPIIHQPAFGPRGSTTGVGNLNYQAFFSPAEPDGMIWGVGPSIIVPTSRDDRLGKDEWAIGPGVVGLKMDGPWVYGSLVSQTWGVDRDADVDFLLVQPFINYNFDDGWYLSSSPIITCNWDADKSGDKWTVPVGGGGGRTFLWGKQPINVSAQVFRNVARPHNGPQWETRLQVSLLYPKRPQPAEPL